MSCYFSFQDFLHEEVVEAVAVGAVAGVVSEEVEVVAAGAVGVDLVDVGAVAVVVVEEGEEEVSLFYSLE